MVGNRLLGGAIAALALASWIALASCDPREPLHKAISSEEIDPDVRAFVGVYEITSFVRNSMECRLEGSYALPERDEYFVVFSRASPGAVAQLMTCESAEQCKVRKPAEATLDQVFSDADGDKLSDDIFSAGNVNRFHQGSKTCIGAFDQTASLVREGDGVRFERRTTFFQYDYPEGGPYLCTTEQARKAAPSRSACNRITVIRGKRAANLE